MSGIAANMKAMCKLLEGDGHMTPIATRQILGVVARWETKPRTVATVEELDALPTGSVVKNCDGRAWIKVGGGIWSRPLGYLDKVWTANQMCAHAPFAILHIPEVPSD